MGCGLFYSSRCVPAFLCRRFLGVLRAKSGKASNSVLNLAISGVQYVTNTKLNTDFTLEQNLDKVVKGLSFKGMIALDNTFVENNRGINDLYNDVQQKWIDPNTGLVLYKNSFDFNNRFDFQEGVKWSPSAGTVNDGASVRNLFYQLQLNYHTKIAQKHDIGALGLFNRYQTATGSEIPHFREDWVFRTTYNYADKYFIEYNGAYNGSEKFDKENRFAFFSSGGVSWIVTKENFMKGTASFLDLLKLRATYGEIGDDNVNGRWLYMSQWAYGGNALMGVTGEAAEQSPYTWYKEASVGNPDVHWEVAKRVILGLTLGFSKDWFQVPLIGIVKTVAISYWTVLEEQYLLIMVQ